ncbi:hypothetical protein FGG08_007136 [Glutinoglossum americanum]|uniref:Uncharacterized protein n=1 Tax=Glutinoglossum americanum TaxID=1670608 RepID=A0A9P8I3Y8_9PEZI|nr:hypothetical protein FGG08_007136 [Glutinoglossum americanum]
MFGGPPRRCPPTHWERLDRRLELKERRLESKDSRLGPKDSRLEWKECRPESKECRLESKDSKPESKDSQARRAPNTLYIRAWVHFELQVHWAMFGVLRRDEKDEVLARTPGGHYPGSPRSPFKAAPST